MPSDARLQPARTAAQRGRSIEADKADGKLHSKDPQLRRVHEHAHAHDEGMDEPGRGSDMGEGQGGSRHNTQ